MTHTLSTLLPFLSPSPCVCGYVYETRHQVHFSHKVSLCLGLDEFPCWVHRCSEFWSSDMAERQEPPDDVPCGANCLKSGLRHAFVKSTLLADLTCICGLLAKDARMLDVLWNVMCIVQVIHDGAPAVCFFLVDFATSFGASTNPHGGILLLFPTQHAEWSQHEQYSIPTPFGR